MMLALLVFGAFLAAGNLLSDSRIEALPSFARHFVHKLVLGLDLEGGIHILLEVDKKAIFAEKISDALPALRRELREKSLTLLQRPRIEHSAETSSILLYPKDIEKGRAVLKPFARRSALDLEEQEGAFRLLLAESAQQEFLVNAMQQSIEIIRRRIDESGTREPLIQRQGDARILVEIPGVKDPEQVKSLLGKTAKLTFHLLHRQGLRSQEQEGALAQGLVSMPSYSGLATSYLVYRQANLGGEHLLDAQTVFEDNRPVVSFRFDTEGARRFGRLTQNNVGEQLAIVLDGRVVSAPRIQSPILGGSGIITGDFSVPEANELALLLRAGALPAPLEILEERTVGPGLGRDSIEAGKRAALIACLLVLVFMIARYRIFGLFASASLIANIVLIFGFLSLLKATLTLPGIAGIVLTTGMAVDANVLIFERIREESRAGGALVTAIEAGYKRAIATILDSNITTLIAALLLFAFGAGPIRGFAVTLSLGLATSMFTAIMLTRFLTGMWLRRVRPKRLPI